MQKQQDIGKAHWLSKPTLVGGVSLSTPDTREVHARRIWRGVDCPKRVAPTSPSGWSKATNSNTHFLRSFLGTSKRAYAYIPESDLKSKLR